MYIFTSSNERVTSLLPLHVISVGTDFEQKPVHRPGGNPFHHIFFVERGVGRFLTASGAYTAGAGTAIYMRKGEPIHYEAVGTDLRTGWVTFGGPAVDGLLEFFRAGTFDCLPGERLHPLLREIAKAAERGTPPAQLSQMAYTLIVSFFDERDRGQRSSALLRAESFIRERFADDLSVAEIAAAAGISESLLYRLFRDREGMTPVAYLRGVRLERAKRYLLECPELRVHEIAPLCGFADSAYFCKVFHDSERMTPGAYRAMMQAI